MSIANVEPSASLTSILGRNSFIVGELASHPLAAPYIPKFEAFQTQWFSTHTARTLLEIEADKAQGVVSGADDALDDFVDTLDRTVLIVVKNDRKAPLYQLYFGLKAPNVLKRPILREELLTCRAWIPSLQTSTVAAVAALAPALVTVVDAADAAVKQKVAADQAVKDFDTIGGKLTLIQAFNALCKGVWGELAAMPHANPAAMLPATFADRFFPHESHKGITSLTNPVEIQARIDSMEADVTAAKSHLAEVEANNAAKAAQKVAEEAADALVAAAKAEEAAAKQKVKDAEKAAKDAKKKPPAPGTPPAPPAPPAG
jgi:hypothetical protein